MDAAGLLTLNPRDLSLESLTRLTEMPVCHINARRQGVFAFTPEQLAALATALPTWRETLVTLDLSEQSLLDPGLFNALSDGEMDHLACLTLSSTQISAAGVACLATALTNLPALRTLDIAHSSAPP